MLGRDRERQAIEHALDRARAGESAALGLVGEPGIGKTALLDHAAQRASDLVLLRARGIESEAQIPFASLLEVLRPTLVMLDRIAEPQAAALEAALALRPGGAQERFAVGAATLSLLAAYAEESPVAVLIDDAQWLDTPSAQALLFALRRLLADPVAVFIAVREGEPSLLDSADLLRLEIGGLSRDEAAELLPTLPRPVVEQLHAATAGNPLAMLELASDPEALQPAPPGAPVLVSARISGAFLRRVETLEDQQRAILALAATSDTGDLAILERAAGHLDLDLTQLAGAEASGLITVVDGRIVFRHPLARSAAYANAAPAQRREAHRALAAALPDRDQDRRAWHLAAAALGIDETASAALEHAGGRSRDRSAYATAAGAFERSARLTGDAERRGRLLLSASEAGWNAGLADRAAELLVEARASTESEELRVEIDELDGRIATRRGPVMRGHAILTAAAGRAPPERAVAMLTEAAVACFHAGDPVEMLAMAERARALLPPRSSTSARFLVAMAAGMARIVAGDGAQGARAIRAAVALAEQSPELLDDLRLLPWLAAGPIFLRESQVGRPLLTLALRTARARAALGALPFVLGLVARDQATTDRWSLAEATYLESIELAREGGQRTGLALGLSGLAWLQARRGLEAECRNAAAEALRLSEKLGTRLHEVWSTAALGELELGLGAAAGAVDHFVHQQQLMSELRIADPDLSPGPDLVDAYLRLGDRGQAAEVAAAFSGAAEANGQPWSLARAARCQGLLASDAEFTDIFELALHYHEQTPDVFETARTQLAFGERLRRARNRVLAREQLRAALEAFEKLGARPWADRAGVELAASGATLRRPDPTTLDELTPQELRIAVLLAHGRTTREAAAMLYLSPKTVEYHLRHVYMKLGLHSREELAAAMSGSRTRPRPDDSRAPAAVVDSSGLAQSR